jgi:hypothetical protein
MTATFMTEEIVTPTLGKNLELVILDHGIGEKVVGNLVELFLVGAIDFDLDRFSDADGADSLETKVLHGTTGGYSGGIKNGGFRHDGDDGFHELRKIGPTG